MHMHEVHLETINWSKTLRATTYALSKLWLTFWYRKNYKEHVVAIKLRKEMNTKGITQQRGVRRRKVVL